jgi:hypothetical protein
MKHPRQALRKVGQALKATTREHRALDAKINRMIETDAPGLDRAYERLERLEATLQNLHCAIEDITCERLNNGWQRWADTPDPDEEEAA